MYFFEGNFSNNDASYFGNSIKKLGDIKIATVLKKDRIPVSTTDENQRKRDERFNADPYIIRCKIVGANKDNPLTDDILPNCFPLMPKHNAIIPKMDEIVLIFEFGFEGERYPERFYVGPIISSLINLNNQSLYAGATAGLAISPISTVVDIDKLPDTKGVFSEYDSDYSYSIDGRDNCDIVFKSSELLLRSGKFIRNTDQVSMNKSNPAYIQIKHGFNYSKPSTGTPLALGVTNTTFSEKISVNNIVANKINLLTYGVDANPEFNLTKRDNKSNKTPYIDDEELNKILETAHPLVFGDILMDYLKILEQAFLGHNHNHLGLSTPIQGNPVISTFITEAPKLREKMLSKNIKIN
jgi:hypothetical protein